MTALESRPLDTPRFALADRIARRVMGQRSVDTATREAVSLLTADADPERAERLAVRPDEPGPLVERLAVWALHRASDEAVARADQVLDSQPPAAVPDLARHPARRAADAPVGVEASLHAACC